MLTRKPSLTCNHGSDDELLRVSGACHALGMRSESNQFRNGYLYRMIGAALMGFVVGVILLVVGPIAVGVIAVILSGVFGTYGVMGIYRRRGLTDAEIDSQEKADRAAVDHIAENVHRNDF